MRRASERNPRKSKEGTKNDRKQYLGDGVFGLASVYWQEPTVPYSIRNNRHSRSVVGGARNEFAVRNRNEVPVRVYLLGGLNGWLAVDGGGELNPLDRNNDDCDRFW